MLSHLRTGGRNLVSSVPSPLTGPIRHATKKAGGSTKNGRDSPGQHFGVKLGGGARVRSGNIIVTQRGTKYRPGLNVKLARNHTLYSVIGTPEDPRDYVVKYEKVVHNTKKRALVSVVPRDEYNFGNEENPVFLDSAFEAKREERAQEKMLRARNRLLSLRKNSVQM